MNNINNKKTEVPKGITLNDKDYLTNLLLLLKDIEKNMAIALTEASNENLFRKYKSMFDGYMDFQRKCYELMFKNGWYQLEEAPKTKITNLIKNLNTEIQDLN